MLNSWAVRRAIFICILLLSFSVLPAVVSAGTPTVTLNLPTDAFIGENFTFTAVFDNTGTENGFAPFIDLIFPVAGTDGADGVDFISAVFAGQPVNATQLTFPASGCVNHPFAVDQFNVPLQVCGRQNDKLVVLALPFGSFTPDQPPASITVTASVSPNADANQPLPIRARGGFQYGRDELSNPCCDPSIVTPFDPNSINFPGGNVSPIVLRPSKLVGALGVPAETATGENFEQAYVITVDVANGENINNLRVVDALPPNLAYVAGSVNVTPASCTATTVPVTPGAQNPPNNQLIVDCVSPFTGGATASDIVIALRVFVPALDANGNPVISGTTGGSVNINNTVNAQGDWQTNDPGDPASVFVTGGNNAPVLAARSIALGKAVALLIDNGAPGPTPGDTLEYRLQFEVSDYFAFDNALIRDTISDGQRWDTIAPTLSFTRNTATSNAAMGAGNFSFTVNSPGTGTTSAVFNVSGELAARGINVGRLIGGCIQDAGTGGAAPDCNTFNGGQTIGTITYRTVIQDAFSDAHLLPGGSGDPSVDEGDTLTNSATVEGRLLAFANLAPTATQNTDTAAGTSTVSRGGITKTVYAYNGSTAIPAPLEVSPGDTVTFRLQYTLPSSDFEDLAFTDYLPLPIFDAAQITAFNPVVSGVPPAAGTAQYGPADTLNGLAGAPVPVITIGTSNNTITFNYGDYDNPANAATVIDLLFTVTVTDRVFARGLSLTNQARAIEGSTNSGFRTADSAVQTGYVTPIMVTHKGVIATNGGSTFTPPVTGPVTFSPVGSGGTRFTGTIGSNGLDANDVNSDLNFAAQGELVSFAIVVENVGNTGAFDIVVRDFLPAGFVIPAGGLNLTVTRGDGTTLSFRAVGETILNINPEAIFTNGLEIVDPGGAPACQTFHPTDGSNIVVITYDLAVDTSVTPPRTLSNAATLASFADAEAAANKVQDITAYANWSSVGVGMAAVPQYFSLIGGTVNLSSGGGAVNVTDPLITKRGDPLFALPGEAVSWYIDVNNNTGVAMVNIDLVDNVPQYLQLLSAQATGGTVTVTGSQVRLTIPSLGAGQRVTLTIQTRVRGNPLPPPLGTTGASAMCTPGGPLLVENVTCMSYNGGQQACAEANVVCTPSRLPSTGESPWSDVRTAGVLLFAGVVMLVVRRRKRL